ncbi:Oxidative stress-induced growth inhibitor 1 [Dufourea novaeangliae]|uniref:Oxidative stress-induced growth inhibitor 1 n=1 Tax=Dufourea novaeangliae TaxID=178035 RepID=A0A154PAY3_DUFNO|nr:Oxidative stress-induced growth inhibitor 1 [Dufourea novaeangliae]
MQNCSGDEQNDVVYKDVVIIGNGPSGICLSYMLAGNWPYYTGEPHPGDEMLTARLHSSTRHGNEDTRNKLESLSSGLEGRIGGRPLSILMDQLQHPCVDMGLDVPSLLTWKTAEQHHEHKVIDHVVLGKGRPGGTWQSMDPNVLTISLNRWMSLPDLDIRQWEKMIESEQLWNMSLTEGGTYAQEFQEKTTGCKTASRISVGTVAAYYDDYVRKKGLEQYFRCGTVVTSVKPVGISHGREEDSQYGWTVEGFETKTGKRFRYRCKRVVLATGTTDSPNRLGIPGEESQTEWVTHDLNDLESKLDRLVDRQNDGELLNRFAPVLVIGAGLSAADAIMAARFRSIPVLHAFRDSSTEWNKADDEKTHHTKYGKLPGLPSSMYPEYHKVYEMMADGGTNYPLYKALPGYTLVQLSSNGNDRIGGAASDFRTVTMSSPDGQLRLFRVSNVAILIGYKPDLSYLEGGGTGLGKYSDKPIDGKTNPIEVDDFTYEMIKAPRTGLYALGPLVGDNFVRYILGGAFGILAHILSTSAT